MYIAPGRGICPFIASFKKKKRISLESDFIYILMFLYMYIAPGQ